MVKSFLYSGWISIFAALCTGFTASPVSTALFLLRYRQTAISNLGGLWSELYGRFNISMTLLCFVMVTITVALLLGLTERNMRYGLKKFSRPAERINETLLSVLPPILIGTAAMFLMQFMESSLILLFHYIFSGLGNTPGAFSIIFAIVIVLLFACLRFYVIAALLLPAPCYYIVGYPMLDNLMYANRLFQLAPFKLFVSTAIPFLACFALEALAMLLRFDIELFNILCCLYLINSLMSLSLTSYFSLTGTERKDIKKKYSYYSDQ